MSADLELGLVYVPTEMPGNDYYGVNRPGTACSVKASWRWTSRPESESGIIRRSTTACGTGICPVRRSCTTADGGRKIKALAQPTKTAFLFVLNRETGAPIWPIEARPVPQSDVPGEKTSPTQPFPTRPPPFDRQGVSIDDLIDFTPELRAEAVEHVKDTGSARYYTARAGPARWPVATLICQRRSAARTGRAGTFDPETNRLYIHSHTAVYTLANVRRILPCLARLIAGLRRGVQSTAGAPASEREEEGARGRRRGGPPRRSRQEAAGPPRTAASRVGRRPRTRCRRGPGGARGGGRGGTTVQGLPLIKPPYDRITAYDMNTGDILWQKTHSSTPDKIKNNPALKGLDLPRLGQPGRTFLGVLTTKTLVIAGEGGVHTNAKASR